MKNVFKMALLSLMVLLVASCSDSRGLNTETSNTTGWAYHNDQTTNFDAREGLNTTVIPGMVPIQGGTFTTGEKDEFLTAPRNNPQRDITVNSFYMDKYEVSNQDWREYLHWMQIVFGPVKKELVAAATPDTTVWRDELAYNEPYVENYLRHPAFSFYPVVGISWEQAMDYCQWRTDRVNEKRLVDAGAMDIPPFAELIPTDDESVKEEWEATTGYEMEEYTIPDPEDPESEITMYRLPYEYIRDRFVFNTEKYLKVADYLPAFGKDPKVDSYGDPRKVDRNDGILVVGFRLPTEAEFEFAAYCPIAGEDGYTTEGRVYPWSGYHPRNLTEKERGQMQANFVRGRGDMMGVSGSLNDKYVITAPVDEYWPNDFGLYNMAGNVNEWVLDVYRETSTQEVTEYNSFRGNVYTRPKQNKDGNFEIDALGRIAVEFASAEDVRAYKDGDAISLIETDYPLESWAVKNLAGRTPKDDPTDILAPDITIKTRVYKGGSWRDRVFWLSPSSRRFMDQDQSSSTIGFRCAMSTAGNQIDNGTGKQ